MPCELLTTTDGRAVLADTGSNWAFGPLFDSPDEAEAFLGWLGTDPRDIMLQAILAGHDPDSALESRYRQWLTKRANDTPASHGTPR